MEDGAPRGRIYPSRQATSRSFSSVPLNLRGSQPPHPTPSVKAAASPPFQTAATLPCSARKAITGAHGSLWVITFPGVRKEEWRRGGGVAAVYLSGSLSPVICFHSWPPRSKPHPLAGKVHIRPNPNQSDSCLSSLISPCLILRFPLLHPRNMAPGPWEGRTPRNNGESSSLGQTLVQIPPSWLCDLGKVA